MTIFGDGQQSRAFTYIQDVIPVIAGAPYNPLALNKVFNIGADTAYTVNDLAEIVAPAMGVKSKVKYLDPRNEVLHAFSSHKRLEEAFGYIAKVSLEEGVSRMAGWARQMGTRRSKVFTGIEIMKNMPQSWQEELL